MLRPYIYYSLLITYYFQETRQKAEGRRQKERRFCLFVPFVAGGHRRQWGCSSETKNAYKISKSLDITSF
ncbi:MAG: hypothetical protein F6J96_05195 [Symploca sp. SIO1C2]|nr:hypothetical protein [Symploca sp. SIO1C2]